MVNRFANSLAMTAAILLFAAHLPHVLLGAEGEKAMPPTPEVKVINGSETRQTVSFPKIDGTLNAEVSAVRLSVHFPGDKTGEEIVFVLREPTTGLIWWEHQWLHPQLPSSPQDSLAAFIGQHRFYSLGDRIVGFHLDGSRIYVRESNERQESFESAMQSILATTKSNLHALYGDSVRGRREVALVKILGKNFFDGSKLVAQWRPSKLIDIARADSGWTVTLEGPDGERASVVLTDDYKVKKADRGGKEVFSESKPQP